MRLGLFFIFVAIPLLELALLLKIGQALGVWWTFFVIVSTAMLGVWVLYAQGFAVLKRTVESLQAGKPPIGPAVDGMFLMIAGGLLLTPGFLADALGLLLLIPPLRHATAAWCVRRLLRSKNVRTTIFGADAVREDRRPGGGTDSRETFRKRAAPDSGAGPIIEGEFERLDERTVDKNRDRPRQ
jgi:UPF0716 protein FxsA